MSEQDYYEILGVDRGADGSALKSAYRKLAMKYHPDRNPGDKSAETRFKKISEAYDVLSNPEKKSAYDQYGHEAFNSGQNGGGFGGGFGSFSDIFEDFFGDMGGRNQSRQERGQDLKYELSVNLREACLGIKKEISFTIQKSFKKGNSINCFASGLINNSNPLFTPNGDMTIKPWSFDFKETLGVWGNRPILVSMNAYSSTSQTNKRNITVIHGSSLEYFANENQLDTNDYNSTKDVWFFKSIENYQNFQNNMNVKESHKISLEDEYQIYQKKYAQLDKTKTITNTKKDKKEKKKKSLLPQKKFRIKN